MTLCNNSFSHRRIFPWVRFSFISALACSIALLSLLGEHAVFSAPNEEALVLQLPAPTLKSTPEDLPTGPNIEPNPDKPPVALIVTKGSTNVALGKSVTTSVNPFTGEALQLTDGKKEAFDYDTIEMKKGSQWVQIDLGEVFIIEAIAIWHDHRYIQVMHDVILQVSDDPEFKTGATTLYNNDTDDSSGLGIGTDREYFERNFGRVFDGKSTKARYVRSYTKGSNLSALNSRQEIEVYAVPGAYQTVTTLSAPTSAASSGQNSRSFSSSTILVEPTLAGSQTKSLAVQISSTQSINSTEAESQKASQTSASTSVQVPIQTSGQAGASTTGTARIDWVVFILGGFAIVTVAFVVFYRVTNRSHRIPTTKPK